jgi:protein disulfide-isomerase/protein disulfide-isomerase A1
MSAGKLCFFILSVFSTTSCAEELVTTLTNANFDGFIRSNSKVLVQFYAPWCGHCKKLGPEYERAAEKLKGRVPLAKVDATVETQLSTKYGVKSYPFLKWFEDTRDTEYDGARTTDAIVEYAESMIVPPVVITSTPPAPEGLYPRVVLRGPSLIESFETVAKMNRRNAKFYFVKDEVQKVTLDHKDEATLELTYGLNRVDAIQSFFKENQFPLFGGLDSESWDKYLNRGAGLVWSLFPMTDSSQMKEVAKENRAMMTEVAQKFKGKYSITFSDTSNPKFKEEYETRLGVTEFPSIAVHKKAGDKKRYVYQGEMAARKITQFIEDVDAGRVEPLYRTEKVPQQKPDLAVKTIVGSNLQANIFDAEKDVMLLVVAPWCGHCKKLDPEYERVMQTIKKEGCDDLVQLMTLDGVANDSPLDSLEWTGFPSLYYIKAGTKEIQKYEGERNEKGIWKWIRRNASKAALIKERIQKNREKEQKASEL